MINILAVDPLAAGSSSPELMCVLIHAMLNGAVSHHDGTSIGPLNAAGHFSCRILSTLHKHCVHAILLRGGLMDVLHNHEA